MNVQLFPELFSAPSGALVGQMATGVAADCFALPCVSPGKLCGPSVRPWLFSRVPFGVSSPVPLHIFFLTVCFSAPSGALVGQMWTVRAPRSPVRPRGLTYRAGSAPRLVESPLAFRLRFLCTFFPYRFFLLLPELWWAKVDSNHRPLGYQPSALTS